MKGEIFHIKNGETQRGPYTLEHINHLAKCGMIKEGTLFWREGMEDWEPITRILKIGRKKLPSIFWKITAGLAVTITVFLLLFGRVTLEAWRELTSSEFSVEGAWWRARGLVREQLPKGEHVEFAPFNSKEVQIDDSKQAVVLVTGRVTGSQGEKPATWEVKLRYNPERSDWSAWSPSEGSLPALHQK